MPWRSQLLFRLQLFEIAQNASHKKENVKFIAFPASLGLGHEYICTHPDLVTIIK